MSYVNSAGKTSRVWLQITAVLAPAAYLLLRPSGQYSTEIANALVALYVPITHLTQSGSCHFSAHLK